MFMEKSGLKILMITPLSAGIVHGGVRMQSQKTAEYLQNIGHSVDLFNPWESCDPESYDCIHLFLAANETLTAAQRLSGLNSKLVVSPVFFTRRSPATIRKVMRLEKFGSQYVTGFFSDYSIKAGVCDAADLVLPNTKAEARLISEGLGINQEKVIVIPNGVDPRFEHASPVLFHGTYGIQNFTLFVGDASAERKNLYPLLKHYKTEDPPLVIIGARNNSPYSEACMQIINTNENIHFLGPMDHDDPLLESAYAAASVFTLPSQFETPGIAALEAALAGCNIAITDVGGTREYFGEHADYIDPENETSIMPAIRAAHEKTKTDTLKNHIKETCTWAAVAQKTEKAYRSIL